jgi:hypothetical protein
MMSVLDDVGRVRSRRTLSGTCRCRVPALGKQVAACCFQDRAYRSYSDLSTTFGSNDDARHAGKKEARPAISAIMRIAVANVVVSIGLISHLDSRQARLASSSLVPWNLASAASNSRCSLSSSSISSSRRRRRRTPKRRRLNSRRIGNEPMFHRSLYNSGWMTPAIRSHACFSFSS